MLRPLRPRRRSRRFVRSAPDPWSRFACPTARRFASGRLSSRHSGDYQMLQMALAASPIVASLLATALVVALLRHDPADVADWALSAALMVAGALFAFLVTPWVVVNF